MGPMTMICLGPVVVAVVVDLVAADVVVCVA